MNIQRSRTTSALTLTLSILALFSSLLGIFDRTLYEDLVLAGRLSKNLLVGSIAQDIISIPISIFLAVISIIYLLHPSFKKFIFIIGLSWYFFYAYGLYVIQGQYTSIYITYLAIFGLSIYSMIFGLLSFQSNKEENYQLPKFLRNSIAVFLLFIIITLTPAWIAKMSTDITKHIPGETYAVFIMDLSIVFPALAIISVKLFKKQPFGTVLAGIALLKAFTLCLSWSFAQWFPPFYIGSNLDFDMTLISTILTSVSLILFIPYILKLKKEDAFNG